MCINFSGNPQLEQNELTLLQYMASKFKLLHDKTITLMIDEIHIKPYMDYKGGNIVGIAFDSANYLLNKCSRFYDEQFIINVS